MAFLLRFVRKDQGRRACGERSAFTLIELLVVLGILGILAAIVITAVAPGRQLVAANDAWRKSAAREILNAITQYVVDTGQLPAGVPTGSSNALPICNAGQAGATGCVDLDILVTEDYLTALPVDPLESSGALIGFTVYQAPQGFVTVEAAYLGMSAANPAVAEGGSTGGGGSESVCNDATDDDADGDEDCEDSDCSVDAACTNCTINGTCDANEICYNDCPTEADQCDDGVDNDNDGDTDTADADCPATCVVGATYPIMLPVGSYPLTAGIATAGKYYLPNTGTNTVSVIDTTTDALVSTISVGTYPIAGLAVGTKLYIVNRDSNNLSVIDTTTDTVTATITVGSSPRVRPTLVGTMLYQSNYTSGTVSVINTATDTVTQTITVGAQPQASLLVGTKLYVTHSATLHSQRYVKVIDTNTNTVTTNITMAYGSYLEPILVGTNLYVALNQPTSSSIQVINTLTDTITATISVGDYPRGMIHVGNKLYVGNYNSINVSIINTDTNTVSSTLSVASRPLGGMVYYGGKVYLANWNSNSLTAISTTTDTVVALITPGLNDANPPTLVGEKIYVPYYNSRAVIAVDVTSDTQCTGL